ncbi:hypothetical protein GCM10008015_30290 [Flavobacterium palustre]|uniref:FAS1 domain-containing protein n=1 Tax=Flavobacterium palustre TaxID=1476463 RepID=A0ABQ1HT62_9FLAO|nr:fasciclin domain-containing protein [Flavobacterium palustre]GGA87581.1 hypothetical protein GCM10008015_30290 [Flavobacterium palustre]
MKKLFKLPQFLRLTLAVLTALVFQNCAQENIKQTTDETLNMTDYIRANPDYSMFLEILNITKYASFMNTYGTYTMFLPTNEAVKQYLKDVGATSLSQVPLVDLQNIAKLHILDKKINTTDFTDGKIVTPSMQGQYLITGAANINGVTYNTINKSSSILASNVEVGNGIIHVIDKVLRVADKTLAQTIEADPNLSLFTEVMKATGWYEKLNQPITFDENNIGSYLTVLAQSNEVFAQAGFTTLDDLKAKYSLSGDPMEPTNGLNLFVQYHVLPNLNYLADLVTTPVFETQAPLEVISSKLIGQMIYLNRDVFAGVLEEGVSIVRDASDITCSNGVLHYVDGHFAIKKRVPLPVYWDLCNQPEFAANTSNYRKAGGVAFGYGAAGFSEITWTGNQTYNVSWQPQPLGWNGDQLSIFRLRPGSGGLQNVTFTTPVIIKGRYKIWVSYRTNGSASTQVKAFFNGVQLSRLINLREAANPISGTSYVPDRVLESQGYKRPMYPFASTAINSRLLGIVEVETTGRHKFTLHSDLDGGEAWFDIVEFRPVDMDQIWPKFKAGLAGAGGLVNREDAPKDN